MRLSALDCVVHQVEEPENFVKEKYAREHEKLSPWSLASLAKSPYEKEGMLGGASGHAFFPASEFAVLRTMLESRGPLHWPPYLLFSGNHTQPRWRFVNHRRLKNLLITMEWLPDVSDQDGAVPGARSAVLGAVSGILGAVPGVPVDVYGQDENGTMYFLRSFFPGQPFRANQFAEDGVTPLNVCTPSLKGAAPRVSAPALLLAVLLALAAWL